MKNKLFVYLILSLFVTSCNDSYLERYPLDKLSSETFWKTENDLSGYSATLYTYIPDYEAILWGDNVSDNQAPIKYNTTAAGLHLADDGKWEWDFIRKCNIFLENYSKADVSDEIKAQYAGEVRFFRAWHYFNRVIVYGDVPYVDKVVNVTDVDILYGPRTPRNEVMDKVIEDLQFAVDNIPAKRTLGRINKYIAQHLLARVYLSEGTYRKYHGFGESKLYFEGAVNAANSIMSQGGYSLHSTGSPDKDYKDLYTQNDLSGNSEMILFKQFDNNLVSHSEMRIRYIAIDNGGLTKDFVEDYLCTDGKPIGLSSLYKGDETLEDEVTNRDPRLLQTIVPPGVGFFGEENGLPDEVVPRLFVAKGAGGSTTATGYHWIKAYNAEAVLADVKAETDLPIFRYAETLLIYAEAKAELGTCTQADVDKSINLLRARVGMPNMIISDLVRDPDSDMLVSAGYLDADVPVLLEEIRRERRVELAVEDFRRNDLLRWKAGKFYEKPVLGAKWSYFLTLKDLNGNLLYDNQSVIDGDIWVNAEGYLEPYQESLKGVGGRKFDSEKHYLEAIPLDEIGLNPALKQNPGW